MGLHTFDTYDPAACQALCDAADLCTAFNIYFERDPTVNPADNCRDPPSVTNIKCTLWGSRLTPETAVNAGQLREDFHVVITGSNGNDLSSACNLERMIRLTKKTQATPKRTHQALKQGMTAQSSSPAQSTPLHPTSA